MTGDVAAVVLAAGAASRFGSPKQQLLLPQVLTRLAPLAEDGTLADVVIVEGAHPLRPYVDSTRWPWARLVVCPGWESGPGASLRCGLAALAEEIQAAVVVLADGPLLSPEAVRRIAATWRRHGSDIVAASYRGERGHPLLVARPAWASAPDEGLRALDPVLVPCDDLGAPGDIDTPEDLS